MGEDILIDVDYEIRDPFGNGRRYYAGYLRWNKVI